MKTTAKILGIAIVSYTIVAHGADLPTSTVVAQPVVVPRAEQYDITSKVNGLKYRIMVSTPQNAEPGKRYPVFYILDGNWYFLPAAYSDAATDPDLLSAIFVGIGYPNEDEKERDRRRAFDLTLPGKQKDFFGSKAGGGDDFIRILLEEVKPLVESHYQVDQARQIIYGKSLGGLLVPHLLFLHPDAFQTYVVASPAIWWDDRSVLADEKKFSQGIKTSNLRLKLLITSAGEEQYRGSDPEIQKQGHLSHH